MKRSSLVVVLILSLSANARALPPERSEPRDFRPVVAVCALAVIAGVTWSSWRTFHPNEGLTASQAAELRRSHPLNGYINFVSFGVGFRGISFGYFDSLASKDARSKPFATAAKFMGTLIAGERPEPRLAKEAESFRLSVTASAKTHKFNLPVLTPGMTPEAWAEQFYQLNDFTVPGVQKRLRQFFHEVFLSEIQFRIRQRALARGISMADLEKKINSPSYFDDYPRTEPWPILGADASFSDLLNSFTKSFKP